MNLKLLSLIPKQNFDFSSFFNPAALPTQFLQDMLTSSNIDQVVAEIKLSGVHAHSNVFWDRSVDPPDISMQSRFRKVLYDLYMEEDAKRGFGPVMGTNTQVGNIDVQIYRNSVYLFIGKSRFIDFC